MRTPRRIAPGPGQESVWDYPRPPRLEMVDARVTVEFGGVVIADTRAAVRVLETSHPPNYYIPRADVRMEHLVRIGGTSICEWKGTAAYYSVVVVPRRAVRAAWTYPEPTTEFAAIRGHIAFYAGAMDVCRVDGEVVVPQPGVFYGGWITSNIVGPFKGGPDSRGW